MNFTPPTFILISFLLATATDPQTADPGVPLIIFLNQQSIPQFNHTISPFATNFLDLFLEENTNLLMPSA